MSTDIWSEVAGDPARPVVVVVHGTMDRSAGMLRLSRRLDDRFHVIRYDRRGYGRSRSAGGPYTVEQHVTDLLDVIDRSAPDRPVALAFGHSFGGNVVLGAAQRRRALIERAAIYETPLSWMPWWPGTTAGGAAAGASDPGDAAEAFMRRLVGDDRWERLPDGIRADRRAEGPVLVGEISDLRRAAPWDADDVTHPMLAICGEHGRPHHQRGMRWLADNVDTAEFAMLPEAGHGAPNTHADELAATLIDFVDAGLTGDG